MGRNIKLKKGTPMKMDDDDAITFDEWMRHVDVYCKRGAGVSVYDLPDMPFRDWYDSRLRPSRAAARAVRNA